MKKTVFEKVVVDHLTGEVTQEEKISVKESEPPFVKLYIDVLLTFNNLSLTLNPILIDLLKLMSYAKNEEDEGQIILLNAYVKERIAKTNNISVKHLERIITDLVKQKIFYRIARGTYQVNAKLFGKGDWKDIKKIRAKIDFNNTEISVKFD